MPNTNTFQFFQWNLNLFQSSTLIRAQVLFHKPSQLYQKIYFVPEQTNHFVSKEYIFVSVFLIHYNWNKFANTILGDIFWRHQNTTQSLITWKISKIIFQFLIFFFVFVLFWFKVHNQTLATHKRVKIISKQSFIRIYTNQKKAFTFTKTKTNSFYPPTTFHSFIKTSTLLSFIPLLSNVGYSFYQTRLNEPNSTILKGFKAQPHILVN